MNEQTETPAAPSAPVPRQTVVRRGKAPEPGPIATEVLDEADEDDGESLADQQPDSHEGPTKKNVRLYRLKIPKSARIAPEDPKLVVMRELDDEALDSVSKLAEGKSERFGAVLAVQAAIVEVDGRRVKHVDDEASIYWSKWSTKTTGLLHKAWAKIHTVDDKEEAAFLAAIEPV